MKKRNWIWLLVTLLLSASALYVMTQQSKTFSPASFRACLRGASPLWLGAALTSMLGMVIFGALGMLAVMKGLNCRRSFSSGLAYSASDLFFSAITPSSTGGQPAALYCMHADGVPLPTASLALLLNLTTYTLSNLIIGLLPMAIRFPVFLSFNPVSKTLILCGCVVHLALITGYTLLALRADGLVRFAERFLPLLRRLRLIKSVEASREKLLNTEAEVQTCITLARANKRMLVQSFACNMGQRICLVLITVFVYLSTGGSVSHCVDVFAAQGFIITGAAPVPLPGAVGVSDYLYLDVFRRYVTDTVSMDILTRGISFYGCMIVCALFTWGWLLMKKRKGKRI